MEASQNPMNHVSKSTKSIYVLIRRTPLMSNALTARRSIRKFQPTPVSPDTIRAIVAVAAYAPSWKNSQTTRYTLLTKREEIDRVADECTMGFQKNIDTLHGAPALVVLTTVNDRSGYERDGSFRDPPHNCAQPRHIIPADPNFEKKRNSSALFAREINLVTQPSFDCEQGINSQVQTACSNADAIFPVLGIVFCKNERFSLLRKTHVPLWNEPRISHVRLP